MSKILDVCLPGTGGMMPLENRWLSSCWMEYKGKGFLIDCGEGTQIALKKARCKLSHLHMLLITHFHADHIAGLPGLLLTLGNSGKTTPLTIVGPVGLERIIRSLTVIAPILPYPLKIKELEEAGDFEESGLTISYLPLNHGVPCFGYGITAKRKPIFNPQKASELGIPKIYYKTLHEGQCVRLEDGRVISPEAVLDGERPSIRVCYFTDTQLMNTMIPFAYGADLLISEGMYGETDKHDVISKKGHMIYSDSAELAKEAAVKKLWLTHYSPALTKPEIYIDNVRKIFPKTIAAYDGIRLTL
ncbi:ribonuclease Z [Aminipila sp.]|uniref:ribonuclease Z n=1 Tax=Aminipila sp. TaxID=2060095 RepID=UPI002899BCE8|nr:ribonuclease Z [Aminipila sp.]